MHSFLSILPSYDLSYQIEPCAEQQQQLFVHPQLIHSQSNCSSNSASSNLKKKSSLSRSSRCDSLESVNSADITTTKFQHSRTNSNASNSEFNVNNGFSITQNDSTKAVLVVKVNVESLDDASNNKVVCYKKICVKDCDRTKEVKRQILEKFLMNPDNADKYNLVQVFSNGAHQSKCHNFDLL